MDDKGNDASQLHGLRQAIFVLEQLCKGMPKNEVIKDLNGDKQLVDMWTNFLMHNHWITFDNHSSAWVLTEKGKRWIDQIEHVIKIDSPALRKP